jgi:hypothetical protein
MFTNCGSAGLVNPGRRMTTGQQFIEIVAGSGFAETFLRVADPVVELYDMAGVHGLVLWSVADLLVGHAPESQPWPR